jgi:spoIIIJ-associated protein
MEQAYPQTSEAAQKQLTRLLELIGIECRLDISAREDGDIIIQMESPDSAMLIGKGAQTLDALQYILNRMLYKQDERALHCTLDVEHYRERRQDKLIANARALADRAVEERRPFSTSPLAAADRRLVHQTLKDRTDVSTLSEPTGIPGIKRVIIEPA